MRDGEAMAEPRESGRPWAVGMFGLGTVGTGVAQLLCQEPGRSRIAHRAGRPIELKAALVRDPHKPRPDCPLPLERRTTDPSRILDDPEIGVVIEVMGGLDEARELIVRALAAGKHVVTANKALLAERGAEVFAEARRARRALAFEASVAGGIPIVHALGVGLAANQVQRLAAILNGTCNYILTAMTGQGLAYQTALRQAQELGYAEADPTLDVDGTDTAHKLAILTQLAFGDGAGMADIPRRGIDQLEPIDIRYTAELGYTIKLLAEAEQTERGLHLRVGPTLVRRGTPLADVGGAYNAIRVVGDAVGDTLFYGAGAGRMPTASAVVGDLIDVVVGRAALTARALDLWREDDVPERLSLQLAPDGSTRHRTYLRFLIDDQPGVVGVLARILGEQGISIASVNQHELDGADEPVPLVITTHIAEHARINAARRAIDALESVRAPSVCFAIHD